MFFEKKIKKQIDRIINKEKPDLIHVQTIRMADYFTNYSIPKTIDMIDALSLNMERRANNENLFKTPIFEIESRLCRNYERNIYKKFDKLFLVSQNDKDYYNKNNKIVVNPNGTFITRDKLSNYFFNKEEHSLVFHGNMQYYPNIESVICFANEIFPELKEKYDDIKFYIVGKDPVEKVKKLDKVPGVIVTGFVDDIIEVLTTKSIGVYFMKSGTGMQNKILEALACKLPSVATPLALQGINGITDSHIKIAENKKKFIDEIINLIENITERDRISKNGHEFIMENYSWEANTKKLVQVWKDVLNTY
jgi:glycosyltransferase involved in cell wall biosynthesis